MNHRRIYVLAVITTLILAVSAQSQTTAFKYQGDLTEAGSPASGAFQMQFRLFDALAAGSQIGSTLTDVPVTATNGVFVVSLDFGSNALSGANRWLEIAVRRTAAQSYVTLSPREQITSSPYAVRTLSAAQADTALDSQKLGGVNANQFVQTNDARLSDARNPLPGSANYIQNQGASPQATSNFNISGNGIVGGNLGIGTGSPQSKLAVQTGDGSYGLTHTNGTVTVGSYVGDAGGWFGTKSNHPFHMFTNDSTPRVTLTTGGNFGIGTQTPTQKLEVNGVIRTSSSATDCPVGWFCSLYGWDMSVVSILASGVTMRSDARFKRNIRPIDKVGEKFLALSGKTYEWAEGESGTHYGFIAQDVEKVFPDLVTTDDRGYKSVDYIALIPFSVEMIKAQERKIHDMELRMARLEEALRRSRASSNPQNRTARRLVR